MTVIYCGKMFYNIGPWPTNTEFRSKCLVVKNMLPWNTPKLFTTLKTFIVPTHPSSQYYRTSCSDN